MVIHAPETPETAATEVDAGVIEEARKRQRQQRLMFATLLLAAAAAVLVILDLTGGGGGSGGQRPAAQRRGRAPGSAQTTHLKATLAPTPDAPQDTGAIGLVRNGVGWAVNGLELAVTHNSGRTWVPTRVPKMAEQGDVVANLYTSTSHAPAVMALSFEEREYFGSCRHPMVNEHDNAPEGYMFGVAVSTSSGRNWRTASLPGCGAASSLSFVSTRVGLAVSGADPKSQWRLYDTTDAGTSWHRLYTLPFKRSDTVSISFINPQDGWAVQYQPNVAERGQLFHTTNGGRTWTPGTICQPATTQTVTVKCGTPTFFSPERGVVVAVATDRTTHASHVLVYSTADGGGSWMTDTLPGDPELTWYLKRKPPAAASTPTPTDWFISVNGYLYTTTDAGHQWSRLLLPHGVRSVSLVFTSAQYGWEISDGVYGKPTAIGGHQWISGGFYSTTDGGRRWTKFRT